MALTRFEIKILREINSDYISKINPGLNDTTREFKLDTIVSGTEVEKRAEINQYLTEKSQTAVASINQLNRSIEDWQSIIDEIDEYKRGRA